jgi:hypothetical protein
MQYTRCSNLLHLAARQQTGNKFLRQAATLGPDALVEQLQQHPVMKGMAAVVAALQQKLRSAGTTVSSSDGSVSSEAMDLSTDCTNNNSSNSYTSSPSDNNVAESRAPIARDADAVVSTGATVTDRLVPYSCDAIGSSVDFGDMSDISSNSSSSSSCSSSSSSSSNGSNNSSNSSSSSSAETTSPATVTHSWARTSPGLTPFIDAHAHENPASASLGVQWGLCAVFGKAVNPNSSIKFAGAQHTAGDSTDPTALHELVAGMGIGDVCCSTASGRYTRRMLLLRNFGDNTVNAGAISMTLFPPAALWSGDDPQHVLELLYGGSELAAIAEHAAGGAGSTVLRDRVARIIHARKHAPHAGSLPLWPMLLSTGESLVSHISYLYYSVPVSAV